MRSDVTLAVGTAAGTPVDLHPLHPMMQGAFRLHCQTDGLKITSVQPEIGHVHRSAEKLLEVRDYRAGAMLANRHIWTAPTTGEYAFVLAAEDLLGLLVSPRAEQLRLVFAELDRVLSHLAYLAPVLAEGGLSPAREALADLLAVTTGSRMHHQVIRIGGVAVDFNRERTDQLLGLLDGVVAEVEQLRDSPLLDGLADVGVVTAETIDSYGISGPIARASGVARDQRTSGYGAYREFVPVLGTDGDARARMLLLIDEVVASCALVRTAIGAREEGELHVRTPKNLRLPEGECYRQVEGALGMQGIWLVSTAGLAPARVRMRTPSLASLQALETVLVGVALEQVSTVLSSWIALAGDADR